MPVIYFQHRHLFRLLSAFFLAAQRDGTESPRRLRVSVVLAAFLYLPIYPLSIPALRFQGGPSPRLRPRVPAEGIFMTHVRLLLQCCLVVTLYAAESCMPTSAQVKNAAPGRRRLRGSEHNSSTSRRLREVMWMGTKMDKHFGKPFSRLLALWQQPLPALKLNAGGVSSILEIGCGDGHALLQAMAMSEAAGAQLCGACLNNAAYNLHKLNDFSWGADAPPAGTRGVLAGDAKALPLVAQQYGIRMPSGTMHLASGDLFNAPLPFQSRAFEFVYTQSTLAKAKHLERLGAIFDEVLRVMADGAQALLELGDTPPCGKDPTRRHTCKFRSPVIRGQEATRVVVDLTGTAPSILANETADEEWAHHLGDTSGHVPLEMAIGKRGGRCVLGTLQVTSRGFLTLTLHTLFDDSRGGSGTCRPSAATARFGRLSGTFVKPSKESSKQAEAALLRELQRRVAQCGERRPGCPSPALGSQWVGSDAGDVLWFEAAVASARLWLRGWTDVFVYSRPGAADEPALTF